MLSVAKRVHCLSCLQNLRSLSIGALTPAGRAYAGALAALLLTACSPPSPPPPVPAPSKQAAKPAPSPQKPPAPKAGPMTFADIARVPSPSKSPPHSFAFEPKGDELAYLSHPSDSMVNDLWVRSINKGQPKRIPLQAAKGLREEDLSHEEKMRRERTRSRAFGITHYDWSPQGESILVASNGSLFVQPKRDTPFAQIYDGKDKGAISPKWSPDGRSIAFVRDAEVHVLNASGKGKPRAITSGAKRKGVTHGLAEYVAQEEMDRSSGFWWSRDGRYIAYTEVDDAQVPAFSLVHHEQGPGQALEHHRYPYAGHNNARVRLGVVPARGGATRWLDLQVPFGPDYYLARVLWLTDNKLLAVIVNREQTEFDLRSFDVRNGRAQVLLHESQKPWINLHRLLALVEEGPHQGSIIWGSERSGYRHLYLIGKEGGIIRPLTSGPWVVTGLAGVDGSKGKVWFSANKDDPTQRQLYQVSLDGGPVQAVTKEPGNHRVEVDPASNRFVDTFSSLVSPPKVTLRELDSGKVLETLDEQNPKAAKDLGCVPPRMVKIKAKDGETLYGLLYTPDPKVFGKGPYPTVMSVYGGPHVQLAQNRWSGTVSMREQFLAQHGYVVLRLDNRGSDNRGFAFESKVAHDLGNLEVKDQVDGVSWLVQEKLSDPARVGIMGWSYGGYLSAMALMRAPKVFKAAVAGAPVTHWDGYDTFYTERYMGLPSKNKEGYERSSVMHHVDKMQGRLMLVHGLVDENVHFRHTARLMKAITGANKDFDLLLYPNERHLPRRQEDRVHMEKRVLDFFDRYLAPAPTSIR